MLFGRKKVIKPTFEFNKSIHEAVMRCSICNGEKVVGFKDKETGHFTEIMCIKEQSDLEKFRMTYGVDSITKEY